MRTCCDGMIEGVIGLEIEEFDFVNVNFLPRGCGFRAGLCRAGGRKKDAERTGEKEQRSGLQLALAKHWCYLTWILAPGN